MENKNKNGFWDKDGYPRHIFIDSNMPGEWVCFRGEDTYQLVTFLKNAKRLNRNKIISAVEDFLATGTDIQKVPKP